MRKSNAFRPGGFDALEGRLALSGLALGAPAELATPTVQPGRVVRAARGPAVDRGTARFEVQWMRDMIGHHDMAIRMARQALRNSESPEVLGLARGIVRAQAREIGQMQAWLSAGYGIRGFRPRIAAEEVPMLAGLRSLRGPAFDRAFLAEMVGHHEQAVQDAEGLLANASHPGLRRLGTDIITTQTAEIRQMRAMLGQAGRMTGTDGAGGHHG
ncbi:DUF305 domain-containing protein [Tautonia sociabilis]|uniref:DUF305 domain-containing protein n=1 Tax=Tautonia sociabilis TaxID=2080755 RepID=A0A432MIL2_9BACT|nr:DUF305 domain-containing protein [Tautonia sociabilis]RUL87045.1 DUF305 domain-containing protein [Tautonia sociabilis]